MRTEIQEHELRVRELEDQIAPLAAELSETKSKLTRLRSAEFIRVNEITRGDVWYSGEDGLPFFHTIGKFAEWIYKQPTKRRWVEWNTKLYHTHDIINGSMYDTPGRWEDVLP